jgi:hypothetical protein
VKPISVEGLFYDDNNDNDDEDDDDNDGDDNIKTKSPFSQKTK